VVIGDMGGGLTEGRERGGTGAKLGRKEREGYQPPPNKNPAGSLQLLLNRTLTFANAARLHVHA
jgi:hypothetical protein